TGVYKFTNVPAGRNYTLTPTKTNYTFKNTSNTAQAFRTYTNLSANQTAQDFTATLNLYKISGRVTLADGTTGIQGVTMTLTSPTPAGFTPRTATTTSTGNYSFASVPAARNYTLTPTKTNFTFSPSSRSYPNLSANQTGAATAFTGTPASAAASAIEFDGSSYGAGEGDGKVEITVKRTGDLSLPASVDYAAGDGTASERSDYSTALGTLHFAPGETTKSFTIFLTDDAFVEGDETVKLTLFGAEGGGMGVRGGTAELTVTDNDSAPSEANPIDDPAFFVRQLYVDFLAREPGPEESDALVNVLNQCAAGDTACDRAAVAARVLLSEESRRRGYFLYRLYDVALGRAPLYREFARDLRQLSETSGGEPNAGRDSFVDEWVKRSREFEGRHGALTDSAYVDQLSRTAAVSSTTRDAALGDLERGSKTRARVLLELVGAEELPQHSAEPASFALLHFGFLRRDPHAGDVITLRALVGPDQQGRREWIRALITSAEYRSRFGRP
ncbi:MAG TPA: Calx-beta domain-containing protein, partial [Blastocatellia bacterium]|nr:Calx-beta domain-containing protein [Blastocatellia bacterium]